MQQQLERRATLYEGNSPADMKVREKGQGESALGTGEEIPLQPVLKTMAKQAVPCSPRSFMMEQIFTLQLMDSTLERMGVPEECCDPMEKVC